MVGRTWVFKLPKEDKERIVPLSRGVAAIVQAHIEAAGEGCRNCDGTEGGR